MDVRKAQYNLPTGANGEHQTWHFETEGELVKMTGYEKPAATSPIAATDTVLDAIGKLEARTSSGASGGGVPIDTESAVSFSFGCDASGVYIVTPDEDEEES